MWKDRSKYTTISEQILAYASNNTATFFTGPTTLQRSTITTFKTSIKAQNTPDPCSSLMGQSGESESYKPMFHWPLYTALKLSLCRAFATLLAIISESPRRPFRCQRCAVQRFAPDTWLCNDVQQIWGSFWEQQCYSTFRFLPSVLLLAASRL